MKKSLILAAAILSLSHQVSAQSGNRYVQVGPVKSIREERAQLTEISAKVVEGPRVLIQVRNYDDQGHAIDEVMNNPDGTLKWKLSWCGRSTFDEHGREIERVSCNTSGEVTGRTVSSYDSHGNLTKALTYGAHGDLTYYDIFEYDGSGHKIRADYYDSNGSTRGNDLFTYDTHGRLSDVLHSANSLQHRDTYKYDDHGNMIEWSSYDVNGTRGLKIVWRYSDESREFPVEFLRYAANDEVTGRESYTYEFDSHGNWIKSKTTRHVFAGQAPVSETEITYRTITYRQPE